MYSALHSDACRGTWAIPRASLRILSMDYWRSALGALTRAESTRQFQGKDKNLLAAQYIRHCTLTHVEGPDQFLEQA